MQGVQQCVACNSDLELDEAVGTTLARYETGCGRALNLPAEPGQSNASSLLFPEAVDDARCESTARLKRRSKTGKKVFGHELEADAGGEVVFPDDARAYGVAYAAGVKQACACHTGKRANVLEPVGVAGEIAIRAARHHATGDGIPGLQVEAIDGAGEQVVLADGVPRIVGVIEADESCAVIAAANEGVTQSLAGEARQTGFPSIEIETLFRRTGREAHEARVNVRLPTVVVSIMNCRSAALLAPLPDALLDAQLPLCRGLLRLARLRTRR